VLSSNVFSTVVVSSPAPVNTSAVPPPEPPLALIIPSVIVIVLPSTLTPPRVEVEAVGSV